MWCSAVSCNRSLTKSVETNRRPALPLVARRHRPRKTAALATTSTSFRPTLDECSTEQNPIRADGPDIQGVPLERHYLVGALMQRSSLPLVSSLVPVPWRPTPLYRRWASLARMAQPCLRTGVTPRPAAKHKLSTFDSWARCRTKPCGWSSCSA